jgi:hypothetical protein
MLNAMNIIRMLQYGGFSKVLATSKKFKISFDVASRTTIMNRNGIVESYVCCEPCRSERVLRTGDQIFNTEKPYRIIPVFGMNSGITYRIGNFTNEVRKASRIQDRSNFGSYQICPQYGSYENAGFEIERIVDAIENRKRIVAVTRYTLKNGDTVTIEYPCKTINYNTGENPFVQIDTGMVVVATNIKYAHITKAMRLAHVAFIDHTTVNFIMEDYLPTVNELVTGADFIDSVVMPCQNSFHIENDQ